MCSCIKNVEPTSPKQRAFVIYLKIMALLQLAIAIVRLCLSDTFYGIYMILGIPVIWLAWSQLSYLGCAIFAYLFCIYSLVYLVSLIFLPVQNNQSFFNEMALQISSLVLFVYYAITSYITYLIYKEFKASKFEQDSVGFGFIAQNGDSEGSQPNQPIQGRGHAIGGASYMGSVPRNQYQTNLVYGNNGDGLAEAGQAYTSQQINLPETLSNQLPQQRQDSSIQQNQRSQAIQAQMESIPRPASNRGSSPQYFTGKGIRIG